MAQTTNYVGELLRVTVTGQNFKLEDLTDSDVTSMNIIIYDSTGTAVVDETTMDWQSEELLWFYLWVTTTTGETVANGGTPLDAGTYKARIRLVDLDGHESWEWIRIRLSKNPVS